MSAPWTPSHALTCRVGFEEDLALECTSRFGLESAKQGPGVVGICGDLPSTALVFEQQRLPGVHSWPLRSLQPIPAALTDAVVNGLHRFPALWAFHTWAMETESESGGSSRLQGVCRALEREVVRRDPVLAKRLVESRRLERRNTGTVVQVVLSQEIVYVSITSLTALSSRRVGGIYRMPLHEDAPSRSYLKLEEAFSRMQVEPGPGESVVDLGAAPGGWTFAAARRGANVWAIDNGPLKIRPGACEGTVEHLRADGLVWMPEPSLRPVDWLVADMLIAPGEAMGLLRRWLDARAMRRVVMNFKIPQRQAWPPLEPLGTFLTQRSGWSFSVRQLYHDRREVTVMGLANTDRPALPESGSGR